MDQIEFLLVGPLVFEIFNLKGAVYGNAGVVRLDLEHEREFIQVGLDGAQVTSYDSR
jgi:hypothetical protein